MKVGDVRDTFWFRLLHFGVNVFVPMKRTGLENFIKKDLLSAKRVAKTATSIATCILLERRGVETDMTMKGLFRCSCSMISMFEFPLYRNWRGYEGGESTATGSNQSKE
eukprot:752021-Hanusia_phi.AAC.2